MDAKTQVVTEKRRAGWPNQPPFVLVVEDDERLRTLIARNLTARGYVVLQAGSFAEAVECLEIRPDLLILDINLPDATGWDVVEWLETVTTAVPMIVISGSPPNLKEMKRFSPRAFLAKPFDMRLLVEVAGRSVSSH